MRPRLVPKIPTLHASAHMCYTNLSLSSTSLAANRINPLSCRRFISNPFVGPPISRRLADDPTDGMLAEDPLLRYHSRLSRYPIPNCTTRSVLVSWRSFHTPSHHRDIAFAHYSRGRHLTLDSLNLGRPDFPPLGYLPPFQRVVVMRPLLSRLCA